MEDSNTEGDLVFVTVIIASNVSSLINQLIPCWASIIMYFRSELEELAMQLNIYMHTMYINVCKCRYIILNITMKKMRPKDYNQMF